MNGCPSNGWGPTEIGWRDLQAWSEMTDTPLAHWECGALLRLSVTYVRVRSEKKPDVPKQ